MEATLESFKTNQANVLKVLLNLQAFLQQGDEFGLAADKTINEKLNNAIRNVTDDKLRVALIGGFSEGKTSIAAAWLERLDKSTMNISHQESSNAVTVYEAGPDCVLIDTPGLFGFKEQENEASGTAEKYKEMTRKYVSEAHLVLYVMDPTNPIKESHRDELNWLFRTLNLLPRSVFVLSRFDAVADVEDASDYARNLIVKKENVVSRLKDLVALSEEEAEQLAIVAVAADPFAMGAEHWLSNPEAFRELSRIKLLQQATSNKVASAGGVSALVAETKRSIVRDILGKQLPIAIQNDLKIAGELSRLEKSNAQLQQTLNKTKGNIENIRLDLADNVVNLFTNLILEAENLSLDSMPEFFERNISSNGDALNTRLQRVFNEHIGPASLEVKNMSLDVDLEVNHFNATVREYGKQGINSVIKSGAINNSTILASRDALVGAVSAVGLDIAEWLKFKPYGAINLAKGVNGALSVIVLGLELVDSYDKYKQNEKFKEAKKTMVSNFQQQRSELLSLIKGQEFIKQFCPELNELQANVKSVEESVRETRSKREQFQHWRSMGEAIDADFKMLDPVFRPTGSHIPPVLPTHLEQRVGNLPQ